MSKNAGPAGTGLIPPGAEPPQPEVDDPDDLEQVDLLDEEPPPAVPEDLDIDGDPPVGEIEEETPEDEEPDGPIDLEVFAQQIEERMQRRFDKAISKIQRRRAEREEPDDEEEPEDEEPPAARSRRPVRRNVDTTAVRVMVRDAIDDRIDANRREERRAVKTVLDRIVPVVDWDEVDDPGDFVDELVEALSSTATGLVRVGSDRKVAQLRHSGMLPKRSPQPEGTPQPSRTLVGTQVAKGAARAQRKWPSGTRRLHER